MLAGLCGVSEETLRRALPSWGNEEDDLSGQDSAGAPLALWRVGGAVVRPVAFGCQLCAARRTGLAVQVVRYAERWERVCGRHGRWLLDADADQPLENLDLRGSPEVVAAQQRWGVMERRARRVGVEPAEVFVLARAVVCRWWEQSLHWEQEEIWPRRLQQVVGGRVSGDIARWRAVGRDAVLFPEVVAVAGALLDPAIEELVWADSGWERPRPLPGDGEFGRRLGELVGRPWLGPLIATDGGPLVSWQAANIRRRRHTAAVDPYDAGPWKVRADQQPPTLAALLREQTREKVAGGSGTNWRSTVPPEQRMFITNLIEAAQEDLLQLRGAHQGRTANAARLLLQRLSHSIGLLDQALRETALAAVTAGVALHDVEQWAGLDTNTTDEDDE
ncbi:DNA-binding protein [Streptomyces sp. NBC_01264]|uniref:DNA-binding protein n=1 Tax=Streptomyces sp. NBC_01264 TaxID=2903804 RepID=UPI0022573AA2|nr:DNA-binding protein [Streptomyces sp. NBC_01264]MCX4775266.1 DNA-binding protein [Streptomyces sp. NBC_01264]